MPISFAIVGPGRLGTALARRWHDAGLSCVGCHGRDAGRVEDALAFVGAGRPLANADLRDAEVVVLSVSDTALPGLAQELADAGAVRPRSLWLHTSGPHGLDVLAPLTARGARVGALHPLAPVPDRETGLRTLPGRHALVEGGADGLHQLRTLAERAGLRPVEAARRVDRRLYHAACALAANGTTALVGLAADLLGRATGLDATRTAAIGGDLGGASCELVAARGAAAALSGPVLRGDHQVVDDHLAALAEASGPGAVRTYRAVMSQALELARARGLAPEAAARIEAVLDGDGVG